MIECLKRKKKSTWLSVAKKPAPPECSLSPTATKVAGLKFEPFIGSAHSRWTGLSWKSHIQRIWFNLCQRSLKWKPESIYHTVLPYRIPCAMWIPTSVPAEYVLCDRILPNWVRERELCDFYWRYIGFGKYIHIASSFRLSLGSPGVFLPTATYCECAVASRRLNVCTYGQTIDGRQSAERFWLTGFLDLVEWWNQSGNAESECT